MDFDAHRLSFGQVAEHYDRSRPTYPAEALAWVLGRTRKRVLDLGAGTGLLTRVVLGLGHEVVAVEPDPGMRERLDAATPGVGALSGTAEAIPLDDGSVDAVVAGQAYHWFDRERAHPEIARVLRPGGTFAPMWNDRETGSEWTARLGEILDSNRVEEGPPADFGPLFTEVEHRSFRHAVRMTPQGVCDLVASRSYYIVASPRRRAEIMGQVRELVATLGEHFDFPYTTNVYRAFRR